MRGALPARSTGHKAAAQGGKPFARRTDGQAVNRASQHDHLSRKVELRMVEQIEEFGAKLAPITPGTLATLININSPTGGWIFSTSVNPRVSQLALKFIFWCAPRRVVRAPTPARMSLCYTTITRRAYIPTYFVEAIINRKVPGVNSGRFPGSGGFEPGLTSS